MDFHKRLFSFPSKREREPTIVVDEVVLVAFRILVDVTNEKTEDQTDDGIHLILCFYRQKRRKSLICYQIVPKMNLQRKRSAITVTAISFFL